ncbi:MAG: YihY/virulence factor BrkB family protein, partial [Armatimonadetes bacterium]|nr:YihY/virulence factor BrkB family protein [Armatimonadota bacterium]
MPPFLENFLQRAPYLRPTVRFGWRLVERWNNDSCPLMAAALAFFGLLSVFPLALAGVTILARFLAGNALALRDFAAFVSGFFPGAAGAGIAGEIERAVRSIAAGPDATTLSIVALGSLLWSGRAYFDTLATVLNRIFPGSTARSFLGHQIALWSLILGTGALFLLSMAVTFGLSLAQSLAARFPDFFINRAPFFWDFLGRGASLTLTFAMFYLLYRFTPHRLTPPRRRIVVASALVATLGWEIAKWGFAQFLGNVTRYEATYGGVAGVVVTMLWIYVSSLIVLAGAEVGATWEEMRKSPEIA